MEDIIEAKSCFDKFGVGIKIIGIGNFGNKIIKHLIEVGERNPDYFLIDTKETKNPISSVKKLIVGENSKDNIFKIKKILAQTDVLIITLRTEEISSVKLAVLVSKIAKEMGILTVAVVSTNKIEEKEIKDKFDMIIPINEEFFIESNKNEISFEKVNEAIMMGIKSIVDTILSRSIFNIDFYDMKTIITNSRIAKIGYGEAKGKDRIIIATKEAINHFLLENSLKEAKDIILTIICSSSTTAMTELYKGFSIVENKIAKPEYLKCANVENDELEDTLQVIILATNFEANVSNDSIVEDKD